MLCAAPKKADSNGRALGYLLGDSSKPGFKRFAA